MQTVDFIGYVINAINKKTLETNAKKVRKQKGLNKNKK